VTAGVNPASSSTSSILGCDLEPLSFDDLPLGGEWTTRRRTVTDADIALFAGVAGDLSPLTIDASRNGGREAPPALVAAIAIGLGTVDMPIPSVAEWEWLNWRFPRPLHAGETIYARWTLTQKRPPVGGASSAVVVWRVDVHTADGALCAEGEVGAKVNRNLGTRQTAVAEPPSTSTRRRRSRGGRSHKNGGAALPEPPPIAAPPAAAAKPERASGPSRRRRRRRPSGSAAKDEEHEPRAAHVPEEAPALPPPPAAAPEPASTRTGSRRKGIGGVLRRLRGT
jgi:acyl dehydratase